MSVSLYNMLFLKPLDEALLDEVASRYQHVITVEDGVVNGGFGSAVLEYFADHEYSVKVKRIGIPNLFATHGTQEELYHLYGMDAEGIYNAITAILKK